MDLNPSRKPLGPIINKRLSRSVVICIAASLGLSGCRGAPLNADTALQADALITDVTTVRLRKRQGWGCFVSVNYRPVDQVSDVSAVIAERGKICRQLKQGKSIRIHYNPKKPDRVELFTPA